MSHHPKILDSKECRFPTVVCQCGWQFTIDPETKRNIWEARKYQEQMFGRYPGDLESVFNGYLLGVHAMHIAQLVTNRLDGRRQTTWLIQSSNVETEQVQHYDNSSYAGYTGMPMRRAIKTRSIPQLIVTLTLRVPVSDDATRNLQDVIQSQRVDLLVPQ